MTENKYEKMANELWDKVDKHIRGDTDLDADGTTIKFTLREVINIYKALNGMARIKKIADSDYGGAEYFR